MEISALRIFKAVAEEGGVTAAAGKINCVQSNITVRIRKLENELGVMLFHRLPRGMVLTSSGRELLLRADKILGLVEETARAVRNDGNPRGPLSLGAYESSTVVWLPALLARFHAEFPEVGLSLQSCEEEVLLRGVLDYSFDGVFLTPLFKDQNLVQVPAFTEEMVLITSPGIESPERIETPTRIVFPKPCAYRDRLKKWFEQAGRRTVRTLELGSINGIIGCVAAGMGISLIPRLAAERAARAGELSIHPVAPELTSLQVNFAYRKGEGPAPALQAFIDVLEKKGIGGGWTW